MADKGPTATESAHQPPPSESGTRTPQDGGHAPPDGSAAPPPAGDAPKSDQPPPSTVQPDAKASKTNPVQPDAKASKTNPVQPDAKASKTNPDSFQTPRNTDQSPPGAGQSHPTVDKDHDTFQTSPGTDKPPPAGDQPPPTTDQPPPAGEKKHSGESLLSGSQSPSMDAIQALGKVRQVDGIHYSVPVTPDHFLIPGGMIPGTEVYVFGLLSPQSQSMDIKFREGRTLEQVSLNVHLATDASPSVSLQTFLDRKTHDVVKEDVPEIFPGSPVCVRVKTYQDSSAKVTINGHTLHFPPSDTFTLKKILYFSVVGDFFTGSVSIFKTEWPEHMHITIGHQISTGYHFIIEGSVTPDADKMMMNILRCSEVHDDILLGVVAQFTDPKQLVRRTKQEGVWLEDQVDQDDPFQPGQPFTVAIAVCEQDFHMTVNGNLLSPYKHKVFYGTGHNLCLEKNIKFKSLNVCSISHPRHWGSKLPNVQKASLLLFEAKSPASTPIDLKPGSSFFVQGTPPPPSNDFKVVLSKGVDETAEALLIIEAQLANGVVFVYDGTAENKGEGLPLRVRANHLFSCRVDALPDSLKVFVNTLSEVWKSDPVEVKQRFPLSDAIFLNTFGELNNVTALKAAEDIMA